MKISKIITSIALLAVTILPASAQKLTTNIGKVDGGYNFWLYTPDASVDQEDEAKPVIIFLHGASLCGNDLNKVTRYGTIDAINKGYKPDAYVIAPQNPGGAWNPKKIMAVVDYVADNHNVDYDRIYVLGMSLGGYGSMDLAATYPDQIAAAMAFCGGASVRDVTSLNNVPLWIVHGTADNRVSVSQSDKVVTSLKNAAGGTAPRLIYDRIPGMNHSEPARLFYRPECYEWLLSHSLKDNNRKMTQGFAITNSFLKNAYQDLRSFVAKSKTSAKPTSSLKKDQNAQ